MRLAGALAALIATASLAACAAGPQGEADDVLPRTLAQLVSQSPPASLRVGYGATNAIWRDVPLSGAGDPYIAISRQGVEIARAPCTDQCRWSGTFELRPGHGSSLTELDLYVVTPQVPAAYGVRVGDGLQAVLSRLPDPGKAVLLRFDSRDDDPVEALCYAVAGSAGASGWVEFFLRPTGTQPLLGRYDAPSTTTRVFSSEATIIAIRRIKHACEEER